MKTTQRTYRFQSDVVMFLLTVCKMSKKKNDLMWNLASCAWKNNVWGCAEIFPELLRYSFLENVGVENLFHQDPSFENKKPKFTRQNTGKEFCGIDCG